MTKINPSRSELRTLKTKAQEGLRIAEQNLNSIAMIRDALKRASKEYLIASKCYQAVYATWEQQLAVVDKLNKQQKVVGSYKSKKKKTEGGTRRKISL